MLSTPALNSIRSHGDIRASYVEISRFFRSFLAPFATPEPRRRSRISLQRKPVVYRAIHNSRSLRQDATIQRIEPECFRAFKSSLDFPPASHDIKDLERPESPRQQVFLHGYLGVRSDLSRNLSFAQLVSKDLGHSIQIVSSAKSAGGGQHLAHEKLKSLETHTAVAVKGLLKVREPAKSKDLGDVKMIRTQEVELWDIHCLNEFPKDIIMKPETVFPPEDRHLQIRSSKSLRDSFAFRAKAANICRRTLSDEYSFTEIETPVLFKSTPEGAAEFIVPTRHKGLAYALPQSPQQFKQIVMASGIPRYYQIARCFRDEDLRADRQPEFTQLDLEMSFAKGVDVMSCITYLVRQLWQELLDIELPESFARMTYQEAMAKFGSDKPDMRLGMPISRIDHLVPADLMSKISPLSKPVLEIMLLQSGALNGDPGFTRKFISDFMDSPEGAPFNENSEGAPGIFIYDTKRPLQGLEPFGFEAALEIERLLEPGEGDLIILQAREDTAFSGGSTAIGNLRLALHKAAVKQGLVSAPRGFEPLWITEFPLFSPISATEPGQGGAAGLASTHHPFTSPKSAADVDLLLSDPTKVIGEHYDLVINGVELGGGSRRIHNADMQKYIMEHVLKMTPERMAEFSHLLEVLRAGCPPHAGIALGFDRLVAVMLGRESIRDVIAFPKNNRGEDPLVKSPGVMSEEVLERYHLQLREDV